MRLVSYKKLILLVSLWSVSYSQISFGGVSINGQGAVNPVFEKISIGDIALSKTQHAIKVGKGEYTSFSLSIYSKKAGEVFLEADQTNLVEVEYDDYVELREGYPSRLTITVINEDVHGSTLVRFAIYSTPFKSPSDYLGEFFIMIENHQSEKIHQSSRVSTNDSYFGTTYSASHNFRYKDITASIGLHHIIRDPSLTLYSDYTNQTSVNATITYNWNPIHLREPLEETMRKRSILTIHSLQDGIKAHIGWKQP